MSQDRALALDPELPGTAPRCSLEHARTARKNYWGARDAKYFDELGAIAVVDLLDCGDLTHTGCGGRMAFFRLPGTDQCEVKSLPRLKRGGRV